LRIHRWEKLALALSQTEFNELVDAHSAVLYRIAYRLTGDRHEAEDVVQETFRSAWSSRRLYQPGHGGRAWLAAILRRRAADRWRSRPRNVFCGDLSREANVAVGQPAEQGYTDEVQRALEKLPDALREALLLVVVGELTHQEAAAVLEVPLGTVLSRVSRARSRMREYLLSAAQP
jgi:RNA polymerase sigma-70 factor (ECF subfamily)